MCFFPYGALLLTGVYGAACFWIISALPDCIGFKCYMEGVDNTTIAWMSLFFASTVACILGVHLLTRKSFRSFAALSFLSMSYALEGVNRMLYGNDGSGDGKGMLAHFVLALIQYLFRVESTMEFYTLTMRVFESITESVRPKCFVVVCHFIKNVVLASFLVIATGSVWCSLDGNMRTPNLQDNANDHEDARHTCIELKNWGEVVFACATGIFWISFANILGTASLYKAKIVLGLPNSLAAASIIILQLLHGFMYLLVLVLEKASKRAKHHDVAKNVVASFAKVMTAYFAHNLIYALLCTKSDKNDSKSPQQLRSLRKETGESSGNVDLETGLRALSGVQVVPFPRTDSSSDHAVQSVDSFSRDLKVPTSIDCDQDMDAISVELGPHPFGMLCTWASSLMYTNGDNNVKMLGPHPERNQMSELGDCQDERAISWDVDNNSVVDSDKPLFSYPSFSNRDSVTSSARQEKIETILPSHQVEMDVQELARVPTEQEFPLGKSTLGRSTDPEAIHCDEMTKSSKELRIQVTEESFMVVPVPSRLSDDVDRNMALSSDSKLESKSIEMSADSSSSAGTGEMNRQHTSSSSPSVEGVASSVSRIAHPACLSKKLSSNSHSSHQSNNMKRRSRRIDKSTETERESWGMASCDSDPVSGSSSRQSVKDIITPMKQRSYPSPPQRSRRRRMQRNSEVSRETLLAENVKTKDKKSDTELGIAGGDRNSVTTIDSGESDNSRFSDTHDFQPSTARSKEIIPIVEKSLDRDSPKPVTSVGEDGEEKTELWWSLLPGTASLLQKKSERTKEASPQNGPTEEDEGMEYPVAWLRNPPRRTVGDVQTRVEEIKQLAMPTSAEETVEKELRSLEQSTLRNSSSLKQQTSADDQTESWWSTVTDNSKLKTHLQELVTALSNISSSQEGRDDDDDDVAPESWWSIDTTGSPDRQT